MAPIRVALIGLSSTAKVSWAAEAHLPYLLSPKGRQHYELVALLNSSVKAAEAARQHFDLPRTTKVYGDPRLLAEDPDIDLVVCNTRVDVHFSSIEPSIKAGKSVFVEWPLTENLQRGLELIGDQSLPASILGLQGRVTPVVLKLKEVLNSGRIGKVLSSDVRAFGNLRPIDALPSTLAYFADRKVGGNPITIDYAHMIDYVHEVLGEFDSFQSRMQIQRPVLNVLDKAFLDKDGAVTGTTSSDVPDFLAVHGLVRSRRTRTEGATLAVTYRSGPPFKGDPSFVWTINGEKGEIQLLSPSGTYIYSGFSYVTPVTLKVHDHASDSVEEISWDWQEWQKELPLKSRVTAELYERFAAWRVDGKLEVELAENKTWPRLHDGITRLKEFEELFAQFDRQ